MEQARNILVRCTEAGHAFRGHRTMNVPL
jgi:hypothetical protein